MIAPFEKLAVQWSEEAPRIPGIFDFKLPKELEASEPPEARGLARDQVRLMVSHSKTNKLAHTGFRKLPEFINQGDVLVINTSGTLKASLNAFRADGTRLKVHLSTRLPGDIWILELRQPVGTSSKPFLSAHAGESIKLPGGGLVTLLTPRDPRLRPKQIPDIPQVRLWLAVLELNGPLRAYLQEFGSPIRYGYVEKEWPISYYQTAYATEMGSAEMPSAGRPFTSELITRLVAHGVQIAPLILHTGVSSLESHEMPYEEYYRVPPETAFQVNAAKTRGKRVIAVGTTSVRALETVTDTNGNAHPGEGWTHLVITPKNSLRIVDSLLTGFHEPRASHLAMLSAFCGIEHLKFAYQEALVEKYLWHEFGDSHLILP
jgi:S-adenosylmethionine:tRNA ribosyltransferase-isomerase